MTDDKFQRRIRIRKITRILTFGAPFRVAVLPRQLVEDAHKGHGHIIYRPRYYQVIVEHHYTRNYDHAVPQAPEQRTESVVHRNRAKSGVLPEGQFHKHQRQTGDYQHYRKRYQESP